MKWFISFLFMLLTSAAQAQWQVPAGNLVVGRGDPVQGFNSIAPGSNGNCLVVSGSTWSSGACSSVPGGTNTQVQFNNAGAFGGLTNTQLGARISATDIAAGTLSVNQGGAGAINGALKGSGAGVVSKAACADLSDGTTNCSAAVGQLPGTATNDSAAVGKVGEFQTASLTGVALGSGGGSNASAITLAAGDWDVWGTCFLGNAGATTYTNISCAMSTANSTLQDPQIQIYVTTAGATYNLPAPVRRISLATSTTVFLVTNNVFSGGSPTANGNIYARRAR